MNILKHPAIRAGRDIVVAVADTLIGGPLKFALRFRRRWAVVLFATVVYWTIGAAIFHLFGPIGVAIASVPLGIWCIAPKSVR